MKNKKAGFTVVEIMFVVVAILGILAVIGWVKNIVKLCHCDFASPYKAEVVYTIGILPPVGAVTGWITIKD